jgi:hypothetical protein
MIPKQLFGSTRAGTVKRSEMERRPQPHNGTLRETRSAGSLRNGCGESVLTRPLEGDLTSPMLEPGHGKVKRLRNTLDSIFGSFDQVLYWPARFSKLIGNGDELAIQCLFQSFCRPSSEQIRYCRVFLSDCCELSLEH